MPTAIGGIANLDGYMERQDTFIYVVAKCREPYSVKSHAIDRVYEELYRIHNASHDGSADSAENISEYVKQSWMNV